MKNFTKPLACVMACLSTVALANQSNEHSIIKFNENIQFIETNYKTTSYVQNKQAYLEQLDFKQFKTMDNLNSISLNDLLNKTGNKQIQSINRSSENGGGVTQLFFEDFQGQTLPNNWAIFDVDGNTPNSNVASFNQAWNIVESTIGSSPAGNYIAASISWYEPEGTSDDWLISPQIHIGPDSILTWLEGTRDAAFPDGYEVYISTTTQDVAGCLNSPLTAGILPEEVATDELTQNTFPFIAQGYSNQLIYVCFRNNTSNGFILEIDDVSVSGTPPPIANDLSLTNPTLPEYTIVPDSIGYVSNLIGVDITNNGSNSQSNMSIMLQIKSNGELTNEFTIPVKDTLASGANVTIALGVINVLPGDRGQFTISYELLLDGVVDQNPADNVVNDLLLVISDGQLMARDDGAISTTFA